MKLALLTLTGEGFLSWGTPAYEVTEVQLVSSSKPDPRKHGRALVKRVIQSPRMARIPTFVDVPGEEPTSNFGERCIRHAVMYRKTSFGTQTSEGRRFVERILTAVMTLKLQPRSVLDYLTAALHAHRRGLSAPSLLPEEDAPQLARAA